MNKLFAPFLPPWAETGLQPAFYDLESGTVLQQTARMYDKVNQLIRLFNELSEETKTTVEEYIAKFVELKDFVDTYFENLDVQEEINNKLDDMAEDGTLQEIITTYIQSNVAWTFDDISEMQSATNLIDGSYAHTYGFHSNGDGGEAFYNIRTKGVSETADNIKTFEVGDELIAELVVDDIVDVKKCGVKGDNSTDETALIQSIIDTFPNKTIFFPKGIYILSSHIDTPANNNKAVCLKLDDYAVIKASDTYSDADTMIVMGGKDYDDYHYYDNFNSFGIEGGTIDCNTITGGVTAKNCTRPYIKNMTIRRVGTNGILLTAGANNGSLDANVQDCNVICSNNTTAFAVNINSSDNTIQNVHTFSGKYGFYFEMAGGNHVVDTHALAVGRDYTSLSDAQDMCAYYFKSGGGNYNYFDRPYSDGYATAFYFDGNHTNYIRDAYVYYWNEEGDTNQHTAVQFSSTMSGRIDGIHCRFPSTGTNTVLKIANTTTVTGWMKELTIHNTANLNDPDDLGFDARFNTDTKSLANADIEKYEHEADTLTINYNGSTVQDHVVNLNFAFSGLTLATGSAVAIKLPVDFRPTSNTNVRAMLLNNPNSTKIIGYITASGALLVNPDSAINGSAVQIIGSYRNN